MVADLVLTSTVYVKFSDIRDADKAYSKIEQLKREWSVSRMTPSRYTVTSHQLENLNYSVSKYEGQVLVKVEFVEPLQRFDAGSMGLLIKELLEKFGDLTAYERGMIKVPVAAYRAEYCNIMAVDDALENLNGFKIGVSSGLKIGYLQMADSHRCVP